VKWKQCFVLLLSKKRPVYTKCYHVGGIEPVKTVRNPVDGVGEEPRGLARIKGSLHPRMER